MLRKYFVKFVCGTEEIYSGWLMAGEADISTLKYFQLQFFMSLHFQFTSCGNLGSRSVF